MKSRPQPLLDPCGVTVIELAIVLVILSILTAITIPSMRGARRSTRIRVAVITAQIYAQGLSAFQLDHGGRAPILGSVDWKGGPSAVAGPVDMLNRPYVKSVPESTGDGRIALADAGTAVSTIAPRTAFGRIRYLRTGGTSWSLIVDRVVDGSYVEHCRISSDSGASQC